MTVQYIDSVKYSRMEAVRAKIDTGSGTACIKVYTTPRPATGGTPTGATLLATINLGNPSGTTTAGDLALSVAAETIIAASGAPNWARVLDRDGAVVLAHARPPGAGKRPGPERRAAPTLLLPSASGPGSGRGRR